MIYGNRKMIDILREKLDCETRTGLVAKAISHEYIHPHQSNMSPIILL